MKKYILNRPVNALKKGYEPAFLGAKIRARKPSEFQAAIIEKAVEKKLHSSEDWNYKAHCVFKGVSDTGDLEYRQCLAPSPSTAAAEAFLINKIAEFSEQFTRKNIYSYKLSNKNSSTNYKYFLPEYEARNAAILSGLASAHDLVAVFFDIEKFYPSIDHRLLKVQLSKFHTTTKGYFDSRIFVDFALNQLSKSPSGVPIGTELSHLLANIYLTDFDKTLAEKFGDRYFRYVDDITIICPRNEVEQVRREINGLISSIGLRPNMSKEEVYSLTEWRSETSKSSVDGEDFFQYCQVLESWIRSDSSRLDTIRRTLRDEGFHIPLEKIVARRSHHTNPNAQNLEVKEIVRRTKELRKKYKNAVSDISQTLVTNTRGTLQKARRAINPLFYLLDTSEYQFILEAAKVDPKLSVQREVSNAVLSNDCTSIINYPGSTVSSYCEIWKTVSTSKTRTPELLIDIHSKQHHQLDALISLALHKVIDVSDKVKEQSTWMALQPGITKRSKNLYGFDNELESLRINLSDEEQDGLLRLRESDDEEIDMQALGLGDQMISS